MGVSSWWIDGTSIKGVIFDNNLVAQTAEVNLAFTGAAQTGVINEREFDVVALPDGDFLLVYNLLVYTPTNDPNDPFIVTEVVQAQRYNPDGTSSGIRFDVLNGEFTTVLDDDYGMPSASVSADGLVFIAGTQITPEGEIFGGIGNDVIEAGIGNDSILGQGNNDTILGGTGDDTLRGGSGNDSIEGGDDDDDLFGQGNNDLLIGGAGNDSLIGAAGADTLQGGIGDDTLTGGNGGDRLDGGAGSDLLNGGANADRLVFGLAYEDDTIAGFEDNIDTIEIAASLAGGHTVASLLADMSITNQVGASVVMDFGGGDILRVNNVGISDLLDDMLIV